MSDSVSTPRLGLGTKVSYGLGSVAQGVGSVALSTTVINYYLVAVVGMRPALVGALLLASLLVDAVVDPAIGRWSDTFRSRWGRRHPFMYASAIPIALATYFLWIHPPGVSGAAMAGYVFSMLVLLRVAGSLYQVPSDALTPELAPDYHTRTDLLSWRWFFGVIGALVVAILLNGVFLAKTKAHPLAQNDPQGYANFGVAAAIIAFVCIVVSSMATHRYIPLLKPAPTRRQSFAQSAREIASILSNPSLLAVMASGLVSGIAAGVSSSIAGFMSFDFWDLTPQTVAFITAMIAPATFVGVIAAPFLSRVLDKKRTMMTVFTLSIFTGVVPVSLRLLGVLPANGSPLIPLILAADGFVSGALGLTGFIIIGSMIADVVEDAAVKTGVRSEGLLFAANGLLPKITNGVGILVGNLMLEFVRFPAAAQKNPLVHVDPAIMRELALISLPAGAVLNLISVAVLAFYRIDRGSHEANLEALRLAATVTEPPSISGGGGLIEPDGTTGVTHV